MYIYVYIYIYMFYVYMYVCVYIYIYHAGGFLKEGLLVWHSSEEFQGEVRGKTDV